jgi:hypothetical protein
MPSTVIRDFQYDSDREELDVTFVSGKIYRYFAVPNDVYVELSVATSKGRFFNRWIRDQYKCVELTDVSS